MVVCVGAVYLILIGAGFPGQASSVVDNSKLCTARYPVFVAVGYE